MSPLTDSLHWMFNSTQNIFKEKKKPRTKNTHSRWLVSVVALNTDGKPASCHRKLLSKHLCCTNWSFNWFSQHSSLCTQHILIATSSCSGTQIVEEKTGTSNQPLLGPITGKRYVGLHQRVEKLAHMKTKTLYSPINARIYIEMHRRNHFMTYMHIKSSCRMP